jgi:hypothetical protein
MERKSFFENISELRENITAYLESRLSLYALIGIGKAVKAITVIIGHITAIFFIGIAFLLFSMAGALYIGRLLESYELGLLIIGGVYLLLGIIFLAFKKALLSGLILRFLINLFFQDDENDKDHHDDVKNSHRE